jgi:TetR/AcrR family transcriptional regulator, repressor for uid operon
MRKADPALHIRRRAQIIAAAEQCFVKRGFHQSSMQDIAAASGLSMGLLYRYFANKESIIEAVAQQDQQAALAAISVLPEQGNVIDAWVTLIVNMAHEAGNPDYSALANEIIAEASRSPKLLEMLRANDAALANAVQHKLEAQHLAGAVAALEDSRMAAQALLMLFDGLTMRLTLGPQQSKNAQALIAKRTVSAILV